LIDHFESINPIFIDYHEQCYGQHYVQGAPAISRELFQKLKLDDNRIGEDTRFNGNAYKITTKRLLIPLVLYQYRDYLSGSRSAEEISDSEAGLSSQQMLI
jgi:hypothetical protein